MKLTKQHREDFVTAVMKDLPRPAYTARKEYIAEYEKVLLDSLPDEVKVVKKLYPETLLIHSVQLRKLRVPYDMRALAEIEGDRFDAYVHAPLVGGEPGIEHSGHTQDAYLEELTERKAYRTRLREVAYGCATREQLVDLLPALERYVPAPAAKQPVNLPVALAGGLVSDLCAAGLKACEK